VCNVKSVKWLVRMLAVRSSASVCLTIGHDRELCGNGLTDWDVVWDGDLGGLVGVAPSYLSDDCHLLSDVGRRPLCSNSNDMRKLLVPRTHNKLGDRSFSAASPRLWNDLPPGLRRPGLTFNSFRQSLKTHLFGDRSA